MQPASAETMTDNPTAALPNTASPIAALVDLNRYPLEDLTGAAARKLVDDCRRDFESHGTLSLDGFLRPEAIAACVDQAAGPIETASFHHQQNHNIYFTKEEPDLPAGHGALTRLNTANRALTCDQLAGTVIRQVYEWPPLCGFLAAILGKERLYPMADPLARLNVMGYGEGEGIGWHFDRARFTVTLLLQAPEAGGEFQYRRDLRDEEDPNYDGVARLLTGQDPMVGHLPLTPGTLNLFAGRYAAHQVTPIIGQRKRLIAVLSFMEQPDVNFDAQDRLQFYGRAETLE